MLPGLSPALSQAFTLQLATALELALCLDCEAKEGLCSAHRWEVLPQLARPAWVRLMGATEAEQTDLQHMSEDDAQRAESHRLAVLRYTEALAKARRRFHRANELKRKLA